MTMRNAGYGKSVARRTISFRAFANSVRPSSVALPSDASSRGS